MSKYYRVPRLEADWDGDDGQVRLTIVIYRYTNQRRPKPAGTSIGDHVDVTLPMDSGHNVYDADAAEVLKWAAVKLAAKNGYAIRLTESESDYLNDDYGHDWLDLLAKQSVDLIED